MNSKRLLGSFTDSRFWSTLAGMRKLYGLRPYCRFGLAFCLFALMPMVACGKPPSSQTPVNCGLACQTPVLATVTLQPTSATGVFLENQPFAIHYTVTSAADHDLQLVLQITFNGQPVLPGSVFISLPHRQSITGLAIVMQPGSGPGSLEATMACIGHIHPLVAKKPNPPDGQLPCGIRGGLPDAEYVVQIAPDKDRDGLSDDVETSLLATYSPLMLFSKDHGSDEKWAPIDVTDYIHGSKLVSKVSKVASLSQATLQSAQTILDLTTVDSRDGGIDNVSSLVGRQAESQAPRALYLTPTSAAQAGTDWGQVLARRNVGLYGHVTPIEVMDLPNEPSTSGAQLRDILQHRYCPGLTVCRKILYKVEYYQFFGFSHDFEVTDTDQALGAFLTLFGIPIPPGDLKPIVRSLIDHDGDWCSVGLLIDPAIPATDKAIVAVYHYAHGLQFRFYMDPAVVTSAPYVLPDNTSHLKADVQEFSGENALAPTPSFPVKGGAGTDAFLAAQNNRVQLARVNSSSIYTHPVVYIEWGGHEFWPTADWSLAYASNHNGQGYAYFAAPPQNVGEVGSPMPSAIGASEVTEFAGYWGSFVNPTENAPPEGPPLHRQWQWPSSTLVSPSVRKGDAPF